MRSPRLLLAVLSALLVPLPARGVASDWAVNGPSRVRLMSEYRVAPGNAAGAWLGLHFRLDPEWHVYWKNSGDAGYPPTVALSGAPAPLQGELLWPAPRRFELRGGLVAFGYADEVVYPIQVRNLAGPAGHTGAGGRETIRAEVDYVVCQVDCIPFHSRLTLEQPLGPPESDPETAPLLAAARTRLPFVIPGASVPQVTTETAFLSVPATVLTVYVHPASAAPGGADLFLEPQDLFETGKPRVTREADGLRFVLPLTAKQVGKPLPPSAPFAWTATGLRLPGTGVRAVALAERATLPLHSTVVMTPAELAVARGLGTLALALLAVLSTVLALGLWGVLGRGGEAPGGAGREALGFLAVAGTFLFLYALSYSVRTEALAGVELSLLVLSLLAWLRRRAAGRGKLAGALVVALGLCAAAAVWLAVQGRIR